MACSRYRLEPPPRAGRLSALVLCGRRPGVGEDWRRRGAPARGIGVSAPGLVGDGLFDRQGERRDEVRPREPFGVAAHGPRIEGRPQGTLEAAGKSLDARPVHEHAGLAVDDRFAGAAPVERDDRAFRTPVIRPGRCRSLRRREGASRGTRDRAAGSARRSASPGTRRRRRQRRSSVSLGPRARRSAMARGHAGRRRWRHRGACTGPARTRSGRLEQSAWRLWRVVVSVYGRIHNARPAIIVSADPPRNILRVREKAVDTRPRWRRPSAPSGASPAA